MTPADRSALQGLVRQWRTKAKLYDENGADDKYRWRSYTLAQCADELASLLAGVPEPPTYSTDLVAAMNEGRWQDATMLLMAKVDRMYRAGVPETPVVCTCAQESAPVFCKLHGDPRR